MRDKLILLAIIHLAVVFSFWARGLSESSPRRQAADTTPDDAVMVEHGDPVGGDPDIALDAGRSEASGQREGVDRVVRGMGPSAPVSEGEGGIELGWEPLLHSRS